MLYLNQSVQLHFRFPYQNSICTKGKNLPFPPVHVKLVQVSSQAILVGAESLVASVDVDCSGPRVENTAVAITALDQSTFRLHYAPCVLGCEGSQRQHHASISIRYTRKNYDGSQQACF